MTWLATHVITAVVGAMAGGTLALAAYALVSVGSDSGNGGLADGGVETGPHGGRPICGGEDMDKRGNGRAVPRCPLCGSGAHMAEVVTAYNLKVHYSVVCDNRGCRLSSVPLAAHCRDDVAAARAEWNAIAGVGSWQ